MRSDAANLLSRLGQSKFKYREFGDSFADMELWPLFEALIRDERISGSAALAQAASPAHPAVQTHQATKSASVRAAAIPETRTALFGRYDDAVPTALDRGLDPASRDIRSLLRELNNRVGQRDL